MRTFLKTTLAITLALLSITSQAALTANNDQRSVQNLLVQRRSTLAKITTETSLGLQINNITQHWTGAASNIQNSQTNVTDYGYGNVFVGGSIIGSGDATTVFEVTGSNNSIGAVTITNADNSTVRIYVRGNYNVIAGMTITTSANSITTLDISGDQNAVGGLTITSSDDSATHLIISASNNTIAGGTFTSTENSEIEVTLNDWNSLSGVIITSSEFAQAIVNVSGASNSISGLTITGSGESLTTMQMPAMGYSDVGRTVVSMMADNTLISVPSELLKLL